MRRLWGQGAEHNIKVKKLCGLGLLWIKAVKVRVQNLCKDVNNDENEAL